MKLAVRLPSTAVAQIAHAQNHDLISSAALLPAFIICNVITPSIATRSLVPSSIQTAVLILFFFDALLRFALLLLI